MSFNVKKIIILPFYFKYLYLKFKVQCKKLYAAIYRAL